MKKIISILAVFGSLAILAAPAFTQVQTPSPAPAPAAQGACSEEGKAALYTDFTTFRTTDAKKAYDAATKYLACSPQEDQYTAYLKKWVAAYDKEARKLKFQPLLYNDKKYQEALTIGKEMLTEDPENLRLLIDLGYGSFLAAANLKQESYNVDALNYARKAVQMIEAGKAPESWAPFKGKEDTLAYLYNVVGRLSLKDNPSAALSSLIKEAQFDTDLKKDPWTYYFIAAAYEAGPYAKMSAEYDKNFKDKDETPESKLALANVNQLVDRIIDAYARAVALAGNDAKLQPQKQEWLARLTDLYKFRKGSDAGLTDMIASVMSKPLPPEPTPLTSLPAGAQTTTTPASGTVSSSGAATGATVPPATTNPTTTMTAGAPVVTPKATTAAATGTTVSTTAKPATTAAKTKPKTRNNHRRH